MPSVEGEAGYPSFGGTIPVRRPHVTLTRRSGTRVGSFLPPIVARMQADVGGSVGDVASIGEVDDIGDVFAVRAVIDSLGVASLTVDQLAIADPVSIRWAGSPSHLPSVAKQLARVPLGQVEYLAPSTKRPRGVDYAIGWVLARSGNSPSTYT